MSKPDDEISLFELLEPVVDRWQLTEAIAAKERAEAERGALASRCTCLTSARDEAIAAKERAERLFDMSECARAEALAAKEQAEAERDEAWRAQEDGERINRTLNECIDVSDFEIERLTSALAGAREAERERCIAAIEAIEPTYWMQERAPLTDDDGTVIMELKPRKMGRLPGLNDAIAAIRALPTTEPAKAEEER